MNRVLLTGLLGLPRTSGPSTPEGWIGTPDDPTLGDTRDTTIPRCWHPCRFTPAATASLTAAAARHGTLVTATGTLGYETHPTDGTRAIITVLTATPITSVPTAPVAEPTISPVGAPHPTLSLAALDIHNAPTVSPWRSLRPPALALPADPYRDASRAPRREDAAVAPEGEAPPTSECGDPGPLTTPPPVDDDADDAEPFDLNAFAPEPPTDGAAITAIRRPYRNARAATVASTATANATPERKPWKGKSKWPKRDDGAPRVNPVRS